MTVLGYSPMDITAEQVQLCLSLAAYAGSTGEAAREDTALHRSISTWLGRMSATADQQIVWGPASFRVYWQPSSSALVVFVTRSETRDDYTVVLRGDGPMSIWDHNLESLSCLEQEPWSWAFGPGNLAPAICGGVNQQLTVVRELTPEEQMPGAGRSLAEYLAARVSELDGDRKLPVHVVGHGVGGTLATVVALWLLDTQGSLSARDLAWDPQHRANLHCTAFAGPTPGNSDFGTYIADRLGARLDLIHNSLDHAPAMWDTHSLSSLADLYRPHVEDPAVVRAIIEALCDELERSGVEYEQPPARIIEGRLNTRLPRTFVAQAEYQHLHAYLELLGLVDVDVDAILERPSGTDDGPVAQ
jgi:pimeloyl-ACP methyl ester carboxylesterase